MAYRNTAHREEQLMSALGAVLIVTAALLIIYYAVTVPVEKTFGERYVDSEIPLIFPFYVISSFKPITLIIYLLFAGVVLILGAYKTHLRKFHTRGLRILLLFIAFASGYELLWNFFAWFATWETTGGALDLLANAQHLYVQLPADFNFSTKTGFLIFALSLYGSMFLADLEESIEKSNSGPRLTRS